MMSPIQHNKTLLFSFGTDSIDNMELYKDPGQVPYWLGKLYGYNVIIDDYVDDNPTITHFRNAALHRYKETGLLKEIKKLHYVYRTAKDTNLLLLIHTSPQSLLRAYAYKLGGGTGKIYLKMDAEASPTGKLMRWENILPIKILYLLLKPLPDLFTIETKRAYSQMSTSCYKDLLGERLFWLPNAFDSEQIDEVDVVRRDVAEKEKIMITVGRLGTHQKNTELLLSALSMVDLRDWKFYLVGPIEESFKSKIEMFYSVRPEKRDSVIFTGMIPQKEKFELYNKARIFVLTSRHESYGFVLAEAAYMNDYIISTDVGCARDAIETVGGKIVDSENAADFVTELARVIDLSDDELNCLVSNSDKSELTWDAVLSENPGIHKLIYSDNYKTSSFKRTTLKILWPLLMLFVHLANILVYILYRKSNIYSVLRKNEWDKKEKTSQ